MNVDALALTLTMGERFANCIKRGRLTLRARGSELDEQVSDVEIARMCHD